MKTWERIFFHSRSFLSFKAMNMKSHAVVVFALLKSEDHLVESLVGKILEIL